MEEFKFRVGGFTRKLPVETADNWFWCRLAIVNKRNRTASAGVHCSVSTQGPPLFRQDLGLGFGFSRKNCPLRLPTIGSGGN